jgi:hypothetical protein
VEYIAPKYEMDTPDLCTEDPLKMVSFEAGERLTNDVISGLKRNAEVENALLHHNALVY